MKVTPWRDRFVRYMAVRQWSPRTQEVYGQELSRFFAFLEAQGVVTVASITREVLEAYRSHLYFTTWRGHRLAPATQGRNLSAVKAFVRFLAQHEYLLLDPGQGVELPRPTHGLPRMLLTEAEVDMLLETPDVTTPLGLRDRAALELLYGTAIRNTELHMLAVDNVHLQHQEVYVRFGKGRQSRVLPLGEDVQKLLGHQHLLSKEVYTRIYPEELLKVYRRTHPRAKRSMTQPDSDQA